MPEPDVRLQAKPQGRETLDILSLLGKALRGFVIRIIILERQLIRRRQLRRRRRIAELVKVDIQSAIDSFTVSA
ncbi:MAG: hypothetical protein V2A66_04625 [Pseudomonadota bacterium]